MSASKPSPENLAQTLVGRIVASFEVYGINSLKTAAPTLPSVAGSTIESVELSEDKRKISIAAGPVTIGINLERVGYWSLKAGTKGWSLGDGPAPTARLVLDGAECLDFAEPSKTKRITIRLETN